MLYRGLTALLILGLGSLMASSGVPPDNSSSKSFLLVANKGDHTVSIVDPELGRQIATVPENGITGHELVASPDGRTAFVPIYGNSGVGRPGTDGQTIDVIDLATRKITGEIDFGHGVRPHCAVFSPKDGMLYITTELDKTVSIIDPPNIEGCGLYSDYPARVPHACHFP